jgi:hypothetical protein
MGLSGFRARLLGVAALGPGPGASPPCASGEAAFRELLAAENAVAPAAHNSHLQWYASRADMAASADLGFTSGPWSDAGGGAARQGQFFSIWTRDPACQWQVEFDAGISHAAAANTDAQLSPAQATPRPPSDPLPLLLRENPIGQATGGFRSASLEDGIAAGLRTFARNNGFLLLLEGDAPMQLAAANKYFTQHPLVGEWQESASGRSGDSTLAYSTGALVDLTHHRRYDGAQIWQYDPKVANWGLRILFIGSGVAVSN